MIFKKYMFFVVLTTLFLFNHTVWAQKERKELETKRLELKKEIQKIMLFLNKTTQKERSLSVQVGELNQKIVTRELLITSMQKELIVLQQELEKNQKELNVLTKEFNTIKKEYADMVYKSYKNKIDDNQLLFILSSENFYQGYLRFQYLKQYATYRKKQGKEIQKKAEKLLVFKDSIQAKKSLKTNLVKDLEEEQNQMKAEKEKQQVLIKKYNKESKSYKSQIKEKQKEEQKLTQQIENLIKVAIKKSGTTTSSFKLAPEAKKLANDFESNKGKLPWPVDDGLVTVKFGTQPDPIDAKLKIESSGVRIATSKDQKARSVFDGVVMAIQKNPQNGILSVLIQHGNYISVYANLKNVSVNKGDTVTTKQAIGTVHTDPVSGQTILKFQIWKEIHKMNPSDWIDKM